MSVPQHDELVHALPYARRYARALSGSQTRGDTLVADSLKALLAQDTIQGDARTFLYRAVTERFDQSFDQSGTPAGSSETGLSRTQRRLLLLTSLEGMSVEQAASIVGLGREAAQRDLGEARERLRASAAADVLIIEDEPIIAMDIEELVQNCGHRVVGIAANERDAVEIARHSRPGLILADINLGAGGDGANAVSRILRIHPAPVIFVTAYPERLLTGETVEPAFVITKPFEPMTLAIATYQAVTGGVHLD